MTLDDPRPDLANERTLLAYQRTALAFLVGGLAASGSREAVDAPGWVYIAGVPLILLSAVVAFAGRRRYAEVSRAMRDGTEIPQSTLAAWLPITIALVAVTTLLAIGIAAAV